MSAAQDDGDLVSANQASTAPDWTMKDTSSGQSVSLSSIDRKGPVVLDFWATWCGPCRAEMPQVEALSKKYAGRVSFYGVNASDAPAAIEAFRSLNHVPYPCLSDADGSVSNSYGAQSIPLVVVIDENGRVRASYDGYDPQRNLVSQISAVLDTLQKENG